MTAFPAAIAQDRHCRASPPPQGHLTVFLNVLVMRPSDELILNGPLRVDIGTGMTDPFNIPTPLPL